MRYCRYCGEEEPDTVVLCNCQQGFTAYLGRLTGHLYFRSRLGFWHDSALTDLIILPLLMFLLLWLFLAWI